MEIEYGYNCSKEEAYNKIDNFLESLQKEHADKISNASKKWNSSKNYMNFSFRTMGYNIRGSIELRPKRLILNGDFSDLPIVARLYIKGKINSIITKTLDDLFKK